MTTPNHEPGAANGAESAEVRKSSNGGGPGAVGKCGKSAEEVRNPCLSSLPVVPECQPMPPADDPAPSLVRFIGREPRERMPADAPPPRGAALASH